VIITGEPRREERDGSTPQAWQGEGDPALRVEHDAVAQRLAVRPSVEALRWAATYGFLGLVAFGISWGLTWDRYGKTPTPHALAHTDLYRFGALLTFLASVVLAVLCVVALTRWRRLAREEDQLFEKLRALRRALGIDP